jgi:hypothetical protein
MTRQTRQTHGGTFFALRPIRAALHIRDSGDGRLAIAQDLRKRSFADPFALPVEREKKRAKSRRICKPEIESFSCSGHPVQDCWIPEKPNLSEASPDGLFGTD